MSALAEALLAAQRQAGTTDDATLAANLTAIGLRDDVDQRLLIDSLAVVKAFGGEAPKATGQANDKPDPATEPASEKQLGYIADLANDRNVIAPDGPLTKEQASKVIEQLKAGTYNADEWVAPF